MLSDKLKEFGVVGAGGAGFPTYVKANSKVEFVIANGAECEPLIHKDVELMKNFPEEIISGLLLMIQSTQAISAKFGIKEKNAEAIDAIQSKIKSKKIELTLLGDFYPSGDEYELVNIATGRLIPPAGIPLQVGCVVNNVETLYNVKLASENKPIINKFITVTGAVNEPKSLWIPIGSSFRDAIEFAGGSTIRDFGIFVSGIMMGTLSFNLDDVITKTTAGLIVLPRDHYLITRKNRPQQDMNRIGKSACDQCSYCTEFCPRYLLGYEVQPHKVMRSLGFTLSGKENWNQWAELCCACGLCTLYACPEELYPKEACDDAKIDMRKSKIKFVQQNPVKKHPMKEYRRVPLSLLRQRLKIEEYEKPAPFDNQILKIGKVRINLLQNIGKPSQPIVKLNQKVETGEKIAQAQESELGVNTHSSIDGFVTMITEKFIEINSKRNSDG